MIIPNPVITLNGAAPGTYTSQLFTNPGGYTKAIVAVFTQSAHTGSPSTTFKIQMKDPNGNNYIDLLVSAGTTTDNQPNALYLGAGLQTISNQSLALPVPDQFRFVAIVGGSGTCTGAISAQTLGAGDALRTNPPIWSAQAAVGGAGGLAAHPT